MEKKNGRPSKFDKCRDKILEMARFGMTEQQIVNILEIDKSTLTKWKQKNESFFTSLKDQKYLADVEVERSLFEKAKGYQHEDVHFSNHMGHVTATPYIKKYAPSDTAAIFWLKNRQPSKWRDKTEVDNNIQGALSVKVEKRTINSKRDIQRRTVTKHNENETISTVSETITGSNFDIDEVF